MTFNDHAWESARGGLQTCKEGLQIRKGGFKGSIINVSMIIHISITYVAADQRQTGNYRLWLLLIKINGQLSSMVVADHNRQATIT